MKLIANSKASYFNADFPFCIIPSSLFSRTVSISLSDFVDSTNYGKRGHNFKSVKISQNRKNSPYFPLRYNSKRNVIL